MEFCCSSHPPDGLLIGQSKIESLCLEKSPVDVLCVSEPRREAEPSGGRTGVHFGVLAGGRH